MPAMPSAQPPAELPVQLVDALPRVLEDEWLETDGHGNYASCTPAMCPTRRYHGLLVASLAGREGRATLLSRFDEHLRVHREPWAFSVARYADTLAPEGHRALEAFELAPWPRASYELGGARLEREVLLVPGRAAVLVRYGIVELEGQAELELRPLLPCRPAGELSQKNDAIDPRIQRGESGFSVQPYAEMPSLHFSLGGAPSELQSDPLWYERVEYAQELERGYDGHEDQWSPGILRARLEPGGQLVVAIAVDAPIEDPQGTWERLSSARLREAESVPAGPRGQLELAARDFLYRDASGRPGVLAGYPWFGEWGRDTFLALPGLTLARGDQAGCAEVLSGALPFLRGGLLPNIYAATPEESHYGSVDAALWFARAVRLYQRSGGSQEQVLEEYLPALTEIAEAWCAGTDLDIELEPGGLVNCGSAALNPTWMDAQVDGVPVTPRHGQAVEIQALWYSLVQQLECLHADKGELRESKRWAKLRRRARRSFLERFWMPEQGMLADVWRDGDRDESVRPNAVIAAALEYSPLSRAQRDGVARVARESLLTPFGLRTLAPDAPGYQGRYEGGMAQRDGAYHQGTVWPWLLGFYTEARLRASTSSRALCEQLATDWQPLLDDLARHGLGQLAEVYDGDAPQRPSGSPAQAWSVAEALRALAMLEHGRA